MLQARGSASHAAPSPLLHRVVVYNPQSLLRADRVNEISAKFKCAALVLLNATCIRLEDELYEWSTSKHHHVLHVGRGQRSTGLALLLHRRFFSRKSVKQVWAAQTPKLKGRLAAVRIKTPTVDIMPILAYAPFNPEEATAFYRELENLLAGKHVQRGNRTIEIWGIDANRHVGLEKLPGCCVLRCLAHATRVRPCEG